MTSDPAPGGKSSLGHSVVVDEIVLVLKRVTLLCWAELSCEI